MTLRRVALLAAAAAALAAAPGAAAAHWPVGQCALPTALPLFAEYSQGSVPVSIRNDIFARARPPLVLAASGSGIPAELRRLGAHTIFWEMRLRAIVGYPSNPTDPATVVPAADSLFDRAASSSACATPLIALNELNGAWIKTPWSATNTQYRANVLTLLQRLHERGARPFLLVNSAPFTGSPEAAGWWHQVAAVADIVREAYFNGQTIAGQGPIVGSRNRRYALRRAVADFTSIGIPHARVGIMHGFHSGRGTGGREGLPIDAWLRVVKWETLAAKQVTGELAAAGTPLGSVWTWGWADFTFVDPDKPLVACVHLWTRDPALCDGPGRAAAAGVPFDASLTEGQLLLPPGVQCSVGSPAGQIDTAAIDALAAFRVDAPQQFIGRPAAFTALLARLVESARVSVPEADILAAEEGVVVRRFNGRRWAYETELRRRGASVEMARAVIADQLRRQRIAATLAPGETYETWTRVTQARALDTAICAGDELPAPGVADVAALVPFLGLPGAPAALPAKVSVAPNVLSARGRDRSRCEIVVSGRVVQPLPGVAYRLEYLPAGTEVWRFVRFLSPEGESGAFRVVFRKRRDARPCPRENVSFRVAGTAADGAEYASATRTLGVQPRVAWTRTPSRRAYAKGASVAWRFRTSPDVTSVRVFRRGCSGARCAQWRRVADVALAGGRGAYTFRVPDRRSYVFRFVFPASELHAATYVLSRVNVRARA